MKIKNLLLLAAASLSVSAFAQQTGELGFQGDGVTPQNVGQATQDHIFVRGTYNDMGTDQVYDNVISFKGGDMQMVWFYLNDDEIYTNEKVQALTPIAYNANGDLYGEITYNSFQCDLYVPQGFELAIGENEDGDEVSFVGGDRMPSTTNMTWGKKENTVTVDGITYDVYTIVCYNANPYGTHLSAKNASKYKNNGPLKKDATLFALYLKNNGVAEHTSDLIVANQFFNFREANIAEWDANDCTFFYGTGGNNESQLFLQYNRVSLYGTSSVVETLGEKTINNVKYYNIAGMESNEPFDGVNIKVVTFNDGTTNTSKVIK